MAKSKYKLGTLVQVENENQEKVYGTVAAVITVATGYRYRLEDSEDEAEVAEEEITNAYKPLGQRKASTRKSPKKSKAAKQLEANA